MNFLNSDNVIHAIKGIFGIIIFIVASMTGMKDKCTLQPQLPYWILGTSSFLFLANLTSLIVKNFGPLKSFLKTFKSDHRRIGNFLDHVHGFFYSTFLVWFTPGVQWVYNSRQEFEYDNKKWCCPTVQRASLYLLLGLGLEVVLRFLYFIFTLISRIRQSKAIKVLDDEVAKLSKQAGCTNTPKSNATGFKGKFGSLMSVIKKKDSTKENSSKVERPIIKNQSKDIEKRASTTRNKIEKGMVAQQSRAFESTEAEIHTSEV